MTGLLTSVNVAATVLGFPRVKLAMSLRLTFITVPSVSVTLLPLAPSPQVKDPLLIELP